MPKAKDYARQYHEATNKEQAVAEIFRQMLLEVEDMARVRQSHSDGCLRGILRDQEQKWRAFARLAGPGIKPDGFKNFLNSEYQAAGIRLDW